MAKTQTSFYIKFNKMPVSLNPMETHLEDALHGNATSLNRRRLKTTNKMVEDALIELHNPKGITLRQVYSFMLANYNFETLTKNRIVLIKKYLIALRESEDIVNITGKGFAGKFKLVDKKKFLKKIELNLRKSKEQHNATKKSLRKTKIAGKENEPKAAEKVLKNKTKTKKKLLPLNEMPIVVPRQLTPVALRHNNISMFDTPMVATQVHASTPFISTGYAPLAPEVNHRKRNVQDDLGTPRTSLPGKKRRLLQRPI
ncbi:uncharacterized protein ACRADG_012821 [Cochliomyia hominivorax]